MYLKSLKLFTNIYIEALTRSSSTVHLTLATTSASTGSRPWVVWVRRQVHDCLSFLFHIPIWTQIRKELGQTQKAKQKPQEILKSITSLGRDGILSSLKGGKIIKEVLHLIKG